MSGVERVEYMDNQKSSVITEAINKEKKLQRQFLQEQEAAGLIKPHVLANDKPKQSLLETVGLPHHHTSHNDDPVQAMNTSISKNMWTSNPGYLLRDGQRLTSVYKQEFLYDQDELDYLKSLGYMGKQHNRRRDDFVNYVEAAAKTKVLMKGSGQS